MDKKNPRYIHETVLRDILDVVSDLKDSDEVQMMMNREKGYTNTSIVKKAENLTLVFPVMCASSVAFPNASMISKAIERKCCTMLQLIFAANCTIDSGDDTEDYLRKIHTNMNFGGGIGSDEELNRLVRKVEDMVEQMDMDQEFPVQVQEAYNLIKRDMMTNLNFYLTPDISDMSLNEKYRVYNIQGQDAVLEAPIRAHDMTGISHANNLKNMMDAVDKDRQLMSQQLFPTDIKKANEMVPSMMVVTVYNSDAKSFTNFVIGVKAKLILVDSYDIIDHIALKTQDRNWVIKLIRSTTREISFFRDFLFAIDKAKADALAQSSRSDYSKIWKLLERRALKSKIRRSLSHVNDASAITTLVMSDEEVDYLAKMHNINILNPSVARGIMDSYNLMGICLVNEHMEVVRFIWDTGNDVYETVTFDHLERESNDGAYKKVVNLVSKLGH